MNQPEPGLVEAAIAALPRWTGESSSGRWFVHKSVQYRNSSIHFIDVDNSSRTRLVYKMRNPTGSREWFRVNPSHVNRAVDVLGTAGLRVSPVLAYDEDRFVVVTLYLEGKEIEPFRWFQTRIDEPQRQVFGSIGLGARLLETVATAPTRSSDQLAIRQHLVERLSRAGLAPEFRESVEDAAIRSYTTAMSAGDPLVMVNRDLNLGNIVVEGDVPGFIDLSFGVGLRGSGLSKLVHRLEFTRQLPSRASTEAVRAVLQGYGPEPAGMVFLRVEQILRMLGASRGTRDVVSVRRRRALKLLKELVTQT